MDEFIKTIQDGVFLNTVRKYYVYRLVDPRTFQTFYVGKGCGDRVLQHVNNVRSLINANEDRYSLKECQIADILSTGKKVISIIHRWGLTEREAYEVEAALIDAYPGLTNQQKGHGHDRGAIALSDLQMISKMTEYQEPSEDYIIIKTFTNAVAIHGNLYDATRICWRANLKKAKNYKYVLSVINGVVCEVYEVTRWYQYNSDRIAFEGSPATNSMASLKQHLIPAKYRKPGLVYPFIYKKP